MAYDPNYVPPPQVQQVQAQLAADPRVTAARTRYLQTHAQADFTAYLEAVKPYLARIDQQQFGLDPATGQINKTDNYGHAWKMAAGMAAGAAPYVAVPGAAAGTAAVAGDGGLAASVGAPAATSGSILSGGAGGSIWGKLAPTLIGVGANIVGSALNARAAGKAADQQSQAAQRAIDLQSQIWQQNQQNEQPFITVGTGAATRLDRLMGGSGGGPQHSLANLAPQTRVAPTAQPLPPNSGGWTGMVPGSPITPMVTMRAPDGSTKPVSPDQVAHYQQLGAQVVQ